MIRIVFLIAFSPSTHTDFQHGSSKEGIENDKYDEVDKTKYEFAQHDKSHCAANDHIPNSYFDCNA